MPPLSPPINSWIGLGGGGPCCAEIHELIGGGGGGMSGTPGPYTKLVIYRPQTLVWDQSLSQTKVLVTFK